MKKVVKIISLWDDSMCIVPTYSMGIEKVGGLPIILLLSNNLENALQIANSVMESSSSIISLRV